MKSVLFRLNMNRSAGYNPICRPEISAKLRCLKSRTRQVDSHKVACRACARIPADVTIPCFDLPNFRSEVSSPNCGHILACWVSRIRRQCAQPRCKRLRCYSKTISDYLIKSTLIECVLAQQGKRRSRYNSRRRNGFAEQKKHRAATVRLRAQIGWRSRV